MYYRDHLISTSCFLDWKLFSFVLRAAVAYRYCTMKSHNGKVDGGSTKSRRVYIMSLLRDVGTCCACTHAYIPVSRCFRTTWCSWANCCWQVTSFPKIPIEYGGRVTRCAISRFATVGLLSRSGYWGDRVSETKAGGGVQGGDWGIAPWNLRKYLYSP